MSIALPVVTSILVGGIAGFLGSLMVTKRMALVGGPLGHLAFPGVALSLVYGFNIFWGGLVTILIGSGLIWFFSLKSELHLEAITAVVFPFTVAVGFLILPLEQAKQALIGDINSVTLFDAVLSLVISVAVFLILKRIYSNVVLGGLSRDLAFSRGVNLKMTNLVYMLSIALVVAIEVKIVGVLLTAALISIPGAAARGFGNSLFEYRMFAGVIGMLSAFLGSLAGLWWSLPAGPVIILIASIFFLVSLLNPLSG